MSLLLLLRADPRASLTADATTGVATAVITFTVDDLDPGVYAGASGLIWRFDPGDGSDPLYFDSGGWTLDPVGSPAVPSPGSHIVYAYVMGTGGPVDATLSVETDTGTYLAARLSIDIDDGVVPTGSLTADVFSGTDSLLVTYTADMIDDAGLTITGWDIDYGDGSFLGLQSGEPSGDVETHTYTGPFFGAARLLIQADGFPSMTVVASGPFITVVEPGTIDPPPVTIRIYDVGGTSPNLTLTTIDEKNAPTIITLNLNDDDECDFTVSLFDLEHTDLVTGQHEVQIIYRGDCYWMRVTHATPDTATGRVTFHCAGLENWFTERFLGEAYDNNLGTQMSFEEDLPLHQPHPENPNPNVWITTGETETSAATMSADRYGHDAIIGQHSARLIGTSTKQQAYLYQNASTTFRPGIELADVVGQKVFMSAWYKIWSDGLQEWQGPPPAGLMFQTHSADTSRNRIAIAALDPHSVKKDVWTRIEIGESDAIHVPAGTGAINWFLGCVPGTILWDGVRLTTDLSLNFQGLDISSICARLARYAQNTMTGPPQPSLKTDLHLPPTIDATGNVMSRDYHLYERSQILDLIREYVDTDTGVDMWVNVDCESGTRHLRFGPAKGRDRPSADFVWGVNCDIAVPTEVDGRNGTNAAVITSQFSGPAGEYGSDEAVDTTWGGVARESVQSAPNDTPIAGLDGLAKEYRVRHHSQEYSPSIVADAALVLDDPAYSLQTGDTINVHIAVGWLHFIDNVRIGSMSINCGTNQVTIVPLTTVLRGRSQKADMKKIIGDLRRRLAAVEQSPTGQDYNPPITRDNIVWGPEAPFPGLASPHDTTPNGGSLDHVYARIPNTSVQDTVIGIYVNNALAGSVTIPAGQLTGYSGKIGVNMKPDGEVLHFVVASVGGDVPRLLVAGRLY